MATVGSGASGFASRDLGQIQRHGAVPGLHIVEIGDVDRQVLLDQLVTERDPQRLEPRPRLIIGADAVRPDEEHEIRHRRRAPSGVSACWTCIISRAIASTTGLCLGWISGESSIIENDGPRGWIFTELFVHSITMGRRQVPLGPL